ncbi:selenocysteine-specific translation elongation factor [Peribacillus kribbensis]|uniref:selenocysteine-specific translation elongation factor n=1 Tax=Peribacillus kribbensis TaxID=356658 RepID=UPI00040A6D98|nr:selenocysteine-specific translation elongation factor [Peribacillus kribbensis]
MTKHFTIGMAGHIDHGKTSLTKALTNVDTDRLKEEKERQISIELGFAPLIQNEELHVSVIDVPGHERFIRQMIAGSAGISLVILVVAADEGVMPQTKEHLEILEFLGVTKGIVAITKIDKVDADFSALVREEIALELEGTFFEDSPLIFVDSLTKKGIEELRNEILSELESLEPLDSAGTFRMPVDQVFTVKGHGTVVRGTVYNGRLSEGHSLFVYPTGLETKARQLQVHNHEVREINAGQRAAVNLAGIAHTEIKRGDILIADPEIRSTKIIDVVFSSARVLSKDLKQRMEVKCYTGTSEVMGRLVFFDRNDVGSDSHDILCQIRLDQEIAVKRGDRFILRRPSPAETVGGGWILDPAAEKYKFGSKTIEMLRKKREGTPLDRILSYLKKEKGAVIKSIANETSLSVETVLDIAAGNGFESYKSGYITHESIEREYLEQVKRKLSEYHETYSLRSGLNIAELYTGFLSLYPRDLQEYFIQKYQEAGILRRKGTTLAWSEFHPHIPGGWNKRADSLLKEIVGQRYIPIDFQEQFAASGIPQQLKTDLLRYWVDRQILTELNDQLVLGKDTFNQAVSLLKNHFPAGFETGEAKELLQLSRKHLIPFLEKMDSEHITTREENKRHWLQ